MLYIIRSDDRNSGNANNFKIHLNNTRFDKNKKYYIYIKNVTPVLNAGNSYLEINIKGIGGVCYDSKNNNLENNNIKLFMHSSDTKTQYYPKYEINNLNLSTIEISTYDLDGNLADLNKIIVMFEIVEKI